MALDLTIAGTVVAFSIVLSGLLIGIGRALGSHKVEYFGREELIQAIVNAALVGAYATITLTVAQISSEMVGESACDAGDALANLECVYSGISEQVYGILTQTLAIHNLVGYYQSIVINFPEISVQPLAHLSSVSLILEGQLLFLHQLLLLSEMHIQLLSFFGPQLLTFFFPLGLIFRSFFSTRKLGGFLIALSIGLYLLYPSLVLVFPQPDFNESQVFLEEVNSNSAYTTIPIIDLNNNSVVASKLTNMSSLTNVTNTTTADFTGDLTESIQHVSSITSSLIIFVLLAPVFSLVVTLIFIKEITDIFGGEFFYSVGML
ncbi:hypothetical protein JW721_05305 [Candidatus Micrarchaeota archaeon]|nr:hypothetical protein [Candidatus Micrarchaeota archaeon]